LSYIICCIRKQIVWKEGKGGSCFGKWSITKCNPLLKEYFIIEKNGRIVKILSLKLRFRMLNAHKFNFVSPKVWILLELVKIRSFVPRNILHMCLMPFVSSPQGFIQYLITLPWNQWLEMATLIFALCWIGWK
jgi:hypothetical protein